MKHMSNFNALATKRLPFTTRERVGNSEYGSEVDRRLPLHFSLPLFLIRYSLMQHPTAAAISGRFNERANSEQRAIPSRLPEPFSLSLFAIPYSLLAHAGDTASVN